MNGYSQCYAAGRWLEEDREWSAVRAALREKLSTVLREFEGADDVQATSLLLARDKQDGSSGSSASTLDSYLGSVRLTVRSGAGYRYRVQTVRFDLSTVLGTRNADYLVLLLRSPVGGRKVAPQLRDEVLGEESALSMLRTAHSAAGAKLCYSGRCIHPLYVQKALLVCVIPRLPDREPRIVLEGGELLKTVRSVAQLADTLEQQYFGGDDYEEELLL